MKVQTTRGRLLASTMICGAAFAALATAAPAFAQDDTEVDAVFVTGSRIPQPNLVTTSPITQVTAEDITTQGVTRVEDLVNQLPQAFAAQNSTVSNGASGTATVDLRGLGSVRTLVLIDGRRMPYGSPNDPAADLNQIPGALVERVEVLTGGASAVYGSDAISGVVNFIMKKDFEGVQLSGQYSFYQHNNDYDGPGNLRAEIARRATTNASQFQLPDDNVIDGYGKEVSMLVGVSSPDDRGNVTAYVTYRNNDAVMQADRDYSACTVGAPTGPLGANTFTCGGSGTSFPGQFTDFSTFALTVGPGRTFIPYSAANNAYNFGPINYYQRPDERYSLGAVGRYEVNDHVEVFTQLMFTDYSTVAQIAPSGNFFSTGTINCGNPLLSAQQAGLIGCSAAEIAADTDEDLYIGRRNVEGGGRQDDLRYQSYRAVVGLRGQLDEAWSYDVAGQYSRVQLSRIYRNDFSVTRLGRALDVVSVGGTPTCRSVVDGTDPNCVPYDIFVLGGVTDEALDYLQVPGIQRAATVQQIVTASIAGDLGAYGIKLPTATNGLQLAFGAEYRRDELESDTDLAFSTGDLAGQGGPTIGLSGVTEVYDLFMEARLPLVEDMPFAKLLSLEVAYRFSDYGTGVNTDTYKIGGDWAPSDDVRFRAAYQKAVRAPNVIELFTAQGLGLFDMDEDPCGLTAVASGDASRFATPAQCAATGVTAAQYGTASLDSPAGQYNFFGGGNPALSPETAKTFTVGVVFTPTFVSGLNVSVDYFNIEVENIITTFGGANTVNACYEGGDAVACARINRNALGNLWTTGGFVEDFNINVGFLETSGYDIVANYGMDAGDFGGLSFNFVGTVLTKLESTNSGDCLGAFGSRCGVPAPEWRHRFRVSWDTPWGIDVSGTWRHIGEVTLDSGDRPLDGTWDAENYFDVFASWKATDSASFRVGVNNVLDNDPPLSYSVGTTGNGNTFPQTYDSLGRYVFMGFTLDF
ncbi:TonB-dependent receptor [Caulobacter sp. SLTY]|uniref:TonB-dependent receptor plug domain-containing protein n=1 Tax=Caulobacter sp. SLTY TaxID=2683262 RepID=UPI001F0E2D43|nr:TonB-dependent receptor [Caulobacter sp. SLTY]